MGGHGDGRNVVLDGQEIADHVAAHEELDLAGDQQHAPVRHGAALENCDVQPVFRVSAVNERLVVTAGLWIGDPVGAERNLVQRQGWSGERNRPGQRRHHRNAHMHPPAVHFIGGSAAAPTPAVGFVSARATPLARSALALVV